MKIKKVQSACLILACIAATGLIGCGETDETPKKHEAITFMAPYLEVDNFIEEVHKTYPEIELEVVPYVQRSKYNNLSAEYVRGR